MKKIIGIKSTFCIFVNPKITIQLENGPLIKATGQVIVCKDKETGKLVTDEIEIVDTNSIVTMGVEVEDHNAFIKHFQTMGIDIYKILNEELDKSIKEQGVGEFLFEQTGIKL